MSFFFFLSFLGDHAFIIVDRSGCWDSFGRLLICGVVICRSRGSGNRRIDRLRQGLERND